MADRWHDPYYPWNPTLRLFTPVVPVEHREEEYESRGFDALRQMQAKHFWYRGRHRFLWGAVRRHVPACLADRLGKLRGIDLGGGCGGWVRYLLQHDRQRWFRELALGDSSLQALRYAASVVGPSVPRIHLDLRALRWNSRWDVVFLLDVLEHLHGEEEILEQVWRATAPKGLLFITTPALQAFWSQNDVAVRHLRRYSRLDLHRLARRTGWAPRDARYFMFFLSPLYFLTRRRRPFRDPEARRQWVQRSHRIPAPPVNIALAAVFALETPLGHLIRFPWGTSVLGVFQRME